MQDLTRALDVEIALAGTVPVALIGHGVSFIELTLKGAMNPLERPSEAVGNAKVRTDAPVRFG